MKIDLKNRQQLLTVLAASVVGLLVADRVIYSPLTRAWKDRESRKEEVTRMIEQGKRLLDQENRWRHTWSDMQSNALPAKVADAELKVYRAMSRWAGDSRASFQSVNPQWRPSSEGDYTTFEVRTEVAGNLQAITRLLYDLEKDPLALKIEDLDLTAKDAGGQQLTLDLRFTGLQLSPVQK